MLESLSSSTNDQVRQRLFRLARTERSRTSLWPMVLLFSAGLAIICGLLLLTYPRMKQSAAALGLPPDITVVQPTAPLVHELQDKPDEGDNFLLYKQLQGNTDEESISLLPIPDEPTLPKREQLSQSAGEPSLSPRPDKTVIDKAQNPASTVNPNVAVQAPRTPQDSTSTDENTPQQNADTMIARLVDKDTDLNNIPTVRDGSPLPIILRQGPWLLQLGSFSSRQQAETAWQQMSANLTSQLNGLHARFETAQLSSGAVVRLLGGYLGDKDSADAWCEWFARREQSCFAVQR